MIFGLSNSADPWSPPRTGCAYAGSLVLAAPAASGLLFLQIFVFLYFTKNSIGNGGFERCIVAKERGCYYGQM